MSGGRAGRAAAGSLFPRLLPLLVFLLVVVSMGAFWAYVTISMTNLKEKGRLVADELSFFLRAELSSRPLLWRYNTLKILHHARSYLVSDPDLAHIFIVDERGGVVGRPGAAELDAVAREKVVWIVAELRMEGRRHGEVWVGMSPERVRKGALRLFLPFLLFGLVLTAFFYAAVRRIVHGGQEEVRTLVRMLEASKRDLERLNEELERKVAARTTELRDANEGLARSRRELSQLAARTVTLHEEESRRISRELHDSVGQALTAIRINLDLLGGGGAGEERREKIRAASIALIDETIDDIRRVLVLLRPAILDDMGLEGAVRKHAESFSRVSGIALDLSVDLGGERPAPAVESTLYRIVQEATTNMAKHSGAARGEIRIRRCAAGAVVLEVSDDGRGFDAGAAGAGEGMGLKGMRERVEMLGGSMQVRSARGEGTALRFVIGKEQE